MLCLCVLLAPAFASAQALDCAALANSAEAEPAGYSEQCLSFGDATESGASSLPAGILPTLAFTYDMRGQPPRPRATLYSFPLSDFSSQTQIGVTQPSLFAMDFTPDGQTLYAVTGNEASPNPSTLGTLDTSTGAFTVIGALTGLAEGDSASGLTIDPFSGEAYFSAFGGSPSTTRLYSLDLATAALTLIGQITAPTDSEPIGTLMIDIAMNCRGMMFGHNISDDALYAIDPATGAGTFIGGHGLPANFAQGMDFDNATGTLYAFIYTGSGSNRFGTFDLATGTFTTLVQDNPLGQYEGAIPTECRDFLFTDDFEQGI